MISKKGFSAFFSINRAALSVNLSVRCCKWDGCSIMSLLLNRGSGGIIRLIIGTSWVPYTVEDTSIRNGPEK